MEIEILTPVHVGSGNRLLMNLDFVVRGNRVVVLDTPKLFGYLIEKGYDAVEIAKIELKELIEDIAVENFKRYSVPFTGVVKSEISEHIKTGGKPYIPGSSIKGAIRTAVLWYAVKNNRRLLDFAIKSLENKISRNRGMVTSKILKEADDELERVVFGKEPRNTRNDIMRAVRVEDSKPFKSLRVYEVRVLGSSRKIGVSVECIDGGKAEVGIDVDDFVLKNLDSSYRDMIKDVDTIAEITREFSEALIEAELKYSYFEKTKNEFRAVKKCKGMVLRLGWGTGWLSSTIGLLLKTHPKFEGLRRRLGLGKNPRTKIVSRVFPKTRKVTADGKPLGWVCIRI
jgi:CRISPR-associated protein Csm5